MRGASCEPGMIRARALVYANVARLEAFTEPAKRVVTRGRGRVGTAAKTLRHLSPREVQSRARTERRARPHGCGTTTPKLARNCAAALEPTRWVFQFDRDCCRPRARKDSRLPLPPVDRS